MCCVAWPVHHNMQHIPEGFNHHFQTLFWTIVLFYAVRKLTDRVWVRLGGSHLIAPNTIGNGKHDCALVSLYWSAPWFSEEQIFEAFEVCAENWPYEGVTNKEFAIALAYLRAKVHYSPETGTLGALLDKKPGRYVALLHGHFISIVNGKIVGPDARSSWRHSTKIYCYWTFSP